MQNSTKLLATVMALPLALGLAMPASAQSRDGAWDGQRYGQSERWSEKRANSNHRSHRTIYSDARIERRLDRLTRQIGQARRSGELSRYEARNFRQKMKSVKRGYHAFARNGLSRRDIRVTMRRIRNVSEQLDNKRHYYSQRARYDDRRGNRRGYSRR